jgi:DNA-binding XRE family transcriptional regulator
LEFGHKLDNMMSIELKTPRDVQREVAGRFKARRLAMNLTQEGLAARAGVSWSSLKRFEQQKGAKCYKAYGEEGINEGSPRKTGPHAIRTPGRRP